MPVADGAGIIALSDGEVVLPRGLRLALRGAPGPRRPALLVHSLASNSRTWDGVGRRLAAAGHEVIAVDLRGHGRSAAPATGHDTATAADDLAELITAWGLVGERAPLVAGHGWGGDVALDLAARHGGLAALALVDGGWTALRDRFPDPEQCWAALAPPQPAALTAEEHERRVRVELAGWPTEGVEGVLASFIVGPDGRSAMRLTRDHHRAIVTSLWALDPRSLYSRVQIPTLLLAAVPRLGARPGPGPVPGRVLGQVPGTGEARAGAREAVAGLADAEVRWYVGGHHDLHAQLPEAVAADLRALLRRAER
jgi:pimeloyl-ACP methyl ester carboxylesterase